MKKILLIGVLLLSSDYLIAQVRFECTNGEGLEMKKRNCERDQEEKTMVWFSASEVLPGYERIGILTAQEKTRAAAIRNAKIYGARATGHAVLLDEANDRSTSDKVAGMITGRGKKFGGNYVFYVYRKRN